MPEKQAPMVEVDVWETPAAAPAPLFTDGIWAVAGEEATAEEIELSAEDLWSREDGRAEGEGGCAGQEQVMAGDYASTDM